MGYDFKDELHVLLATRDGRVPPETWTFLVFVASKMGRVLHMHKSQSTWFMRARYECCADVYNHIDKDADCVKYGLFLDDDIKVDYRDTEEFLKMANYTVNAIEKIEDGGLNGWFAHYKQLDGKSTAFKSDYSQYSMNELGALPDFAPIPYSALGFAYIKVPRNYNWHIDAVWTDDFYFEKDMGMGGLHYAKGIKLKHLKNVEV